MPALECSEIEAVRVVALPVALDVAQLSDDGESMIRIAPDEALFIGDASPEDIQIADPAAIVSIDLGWSGAWMSLRSFDELCAHTIDWQIPIERPTVAQGLVAGVPAKVWFRSNEDDVLLFVQTAFAHELIERLG